MRRRFGMLCAAFAVMTFMLIAAQAQAAPKTFAVLPFSINGPSSYKYLEQAIPPMMQSRMFWKDNLHPLETAGKKLSPISTEQEARAIQKSLGADYVIWGSVTIVGEECSIDAKAIGEGTQIWHRAGKAKLANLITAMEGLSDGLMQDITGRGASMAPGAVAGTVSPSMHPSIVQNETQQQTTYLNPQFKYQGDTGDGDVLRSQTLPFVSSGMLVEDVNKDGVTEIFLLERRKIHAFTWDKGRLVPIATFDGPSMVQLLNIKTLDTGGQKLLVVSGVEDKSTLPFSFILRFDGKQFSVDVDRIRFFLNVVKMPPTYKETLIGQAGEGSRMFRPGVFEMVKNGNSLMKGGSINLPADANVFNFIWLPAKNSAEDKLIILTDSEQLRVMNAQGSRLAQTDEKYSGTSKGIETTNDMPGMGKDPLYIPAQYYIPMNMPVADLEQDGRYEVLVNRPISTASQFFENYRFFPQGEIHSLYWDGVGLNLQWKTRRIKGSVVDIAIVDLNGDKKLDLVVNVNTHPGALGIEARKTLIMAYPLDLTLTDPKAAKDLSDFAE